MSTKTLTTLQQFYELPEDESGYTYELDRGELIKMPPSPAKHERIKNRIAKLLILALQKSDLGEVLVETGFEIDSESWRRPDVSFIGKERVKQIDDEKPLAGAPDIAIEVYSVSDSIRILNRKVRHFLETGSQAVWVIYPNSKEVNIISKTADTWLGEGDTLESPDLLPGLSIPVRKLFED